MLAKLYEIPIYCTVIDDSSLTERQSRHRQFKNYGDLIQHMADSACAVLKKGKLKFYEGLDSDFVDCINETMILYFVTLISKTREKGSNGFRSLYVAADVNDVNVMNDFLQDSFRENQYDFNVNLCWFYSDYPIANDNQIYSLFDDGMASTIRES